MSDWIPGDKFDETLYGRLNQQPGARNYERGPFDRSSIPLGGTVVPDPKDGNFGIVVDRNGVAVRKVDLK